jgi:hypothetical protein
MTSRTIHRHRHRELLHTAKEQASSAAALADRKRRQHLMERSFADETFKLIAPPGQIVIDLPWHVDRRQCVKTM